jgi:hypothetical protein
MGAATVEILDMFWVDAHGKYGYVSRRTEDHINPISSEP